MKTLRIIFTILLISSFTFSAYALNLEVDNDLNNFANQNLLDVGDTQSLKNPFFIKKEVMEAPEEIEAAADLADNIIDDNRDGPETVSKPEIIINGVITAASNRMALIVSYNQDKHLLKIGDIMDGYRLSSYKNGEATFVKNGDITKVSY